MQLLTGSRQSINDVFPDDGGSNIGTMAVVGGGQGVLDSFNGFQDSVIGILNLGVSAIHFFEGNHSLPFIPSPQWARDKLVTQTEFEYNTSKFLGGLGISIFVGGGLGSLGGTGAAGVQTATLAVQAQAELAVAGAGAMAVVTPATAGAVAGEAVGVIGQMVQMSTGGTAPNSAPSLPGRVQSRINISNEGWDHVVKRHFSGKSNASQFTVTQDELRGILQSEEVVKTPITRTLQSTEGTLYVRDVDLGRQIGLDKFNNMNPTNVMSVVTDKFGNLKTVTPGIIY